MSKSYDIFLSHSGAQKVFVKQLVEELTREYGHYSVFYDEDSIKHGESISSSIVENAKRCKLAVAVLSEEYFTGSKAPMLELAASYKASKNGNGVPCLLPVFFELRPEHVKNSVYQGSLINTWKILKTNERMSPRISYESRTNKVEPEIWEEAFYKLLEIRGPVYEPDENKKEPAVFVEKVASAIVDKLDELSGTKVSWYRKLCNAIRHFLFLCAHHRSHATDLSDSVSTERLSEDFDSPDSPQSSDQREGASTSGATLKEFKCKVCFEYTKREEDLAELERKVGELEGKVKERELYLQDLERKVNTSGASFRKFRFCPVLWWKFKTPNMPATMVERT